jgi:hypothetical protein
LGRNVKNRGGPCLNLNPGLGLSLSQEAGE